MRMPEELTVPERVRNHGTYVHAPAPLPPLHSVLVGRAAMFDMLTVFACYLAIIAGEEMWFGE